MTTVPSTEKNLMNDARCFLSPPAFIQPRQLSAPTAWVGHIPFGSWLIATQKPRLFVELGTHRGNSYFAFCQTVQENALETRCYAVDTWQGDEHAGQYEDAIFDEVAGYHNRNYDAFSRLLRMTFDDATHYFADGSIDLLHIDGLHTYEAVLHDFETWLPKLSQRGVVLFHDINVRERGFGVWKLWDELSAKFAHIHFEHSHGLGVLFVGPESQSEFHEEIQAFKRNELAVKKVFSYLGQRIVQEFEATTHGQVLAARNEEIAFLKKLVAERDDYLTLRTQQMEQHLQMIRERDASLHQLGQQIGMYAQQIAERDAALAVRTEELRQRGELLDQRAAQLEAAARQIGERDASLTQAAAQAAAYQQTIDTLNQHLAYRAGLKFWLKSPFRFIRRAVNA